MSDLMAPIYLRRPTVMQLKICVVEDNIIVADLLCSMLNNCGYAVTEPALSYHMALQIIESEKPDLLLLDIDLAGEKDGIDLAWKIKDEYRLPFAFITAQNDDGTIQKAQLTHPFGYFLKPVNQQLLVEAIEDGYQLFQSDTSVG